MHIQFLCLLTYVTPTSWKLISRHKKWKFQKIVKNVPLRTLHEPWYRPPSVKESHGRTPWWVRGLPWGGCLPRHPSHAMVPIMCHEVVSCSVPSQAKTPLHFMTHTTTLSALHESLWTTLKGSVQEWFWGLSGDTWVFYLNPKSVF